MPRLICFREIVTLSDFESPSRRPARQVHPHQIAMRLERRYLRLFIQFEAVAA